MCICKSWQFLQGIIVTIISSHIIIFLCKDLCKQIFGTWETLLMYGVWGLWCREYLLEVKVRLLEQLSCGFNSPQLAIEFIQMLLDEYSILCMALPTLLYLLEPLVSFLPPSLLPSMFALTSHALANCVCTYKYLCYLHMSQMFVLSVLHVVFACRSNFCLCAFVLYEVMSM